MSTTKTGLVLLSAIISPVVITFGIHKFLRATCTPPGMLSFNVCQEYKDAYKNELDSKYGKGWENAPKDRELRRIDM